MPGKHVRWASTNIHYSPDPLTPSPSYSNSSLPSSSGPITPPQALSIPLPYHHPGFHKARVHHPMAPVRLNMYLALAHRPLIDYNISQSPSHARPHGFTSAIFAEPATVPPVRFLTIVSPHLPWAIPVPGIAPNAFVTIYDVLARLHHALRNGASEREFLMLPPKARSRVRASYENRYRRIRDRRAYEAEKSNGLKKIDFLMGHSTFLGLAPSNDGPTTFVLNVS
jgi:hypothetical protein